MTELDLELDLNSMAGSCRPARRFGSVYGTWRSTESTGPRYRGS